ncbi:dTMP kinase [Desulfofalx alkaliphila]|uniref:dTMP kinase n=1 Tax=Desulfofalx alkaliphila TaxID=105483 RepID=UPI0004E1E795|nr:dTMP kinase [Desulfofalx alkaliphila]
MSGKLIVFEGIDGAGKSTQLSMLYQYLQQRGYNLMTTREPGGTPVGEEVRSILLNPLHGDLQHRAEAFLYAAARSQLVYQVIKPALREGKIVLCDRFVDSTMAYQGYGRGISRNFLQQINDLATGGLQADLVLVFDLPVEESFKRVNKRSTGDRLEQETHSFFQRVREGYLEIARQQCHNHLVMDASLSVEELQRQVRTVVDNFIDGKLRESD